MIDPTLNLLQKIDDLENDKAMYKSLCDTAQAELRASQAECRRLTANLICKLTADDERVEKTEAERDAARNKLAEAVTFIKAVAANRTLYCTGEAVADDRVNQLSDAAQVFLASVNP